VQPISSLIPTKTVYKPHVKLRTVQNVSKQMQINAKNVSKVTIWINKLTNVINAKFKTVNNANKIPYLIANYAILNIRWINKILVVTL
jgi:hypothetical protein